MRAVRPLLLAALLVLAGRVAEAENLITTLSKSEVRISSNFSGDTVTLFGAIERDAATVSRTADYEVVAVMRGPAEAVVVRRKQRVFGIWINRDARTFAATPSFYVLHATKPLDDIANDVILRRLGIGIDRVLQQSGTGGRAFAQALVRLKEKSWLFAERPGSVEMLGSGIFRTTLPLPANVPVGPYVVEVYLFNDSVLLARSAERFNITKAGFEQIVSGFSREQPLIFGVGCVAMALAIGWLAGVIFRRD